MANELGIPSREGLMRNRYLGRSFIEGANRSEVVRRKFTPIPEVLSGKRVFLVEDSIVRSTTLRVIVRLLREQGGAKEVHVRVACPPIMAPCGYGIDMSTVSELFAPKHFAEPCRGDLPADDLQKAEQDLGADSLRYLSVDALTNAIGLDENKLCLGCLIGKYPTVWGGKTYEEALRTRDDPDLRRTYERIS
jgi:amidophosphoribosyltransferase